MSSVYDVEDINKWRNIYLQQAKDFDELKRLNTSLRNELDFLKKDSDRVLYIKETSDMDVIETKINKKEAYTLVVDKFNELRNMYNELKNNYSEIQQFNEHYIKRIEELISKNNELESRYEKVLKNYNDMSVLDRLKKKSLT